MTSEVYACRTVFLDLMLLEDIEIKDGCSGSSNLLCQGGLGGKGPDPAASLSPGTMYPDQLQEAIVTIMSSNRCKYYWKDLSLDDILCAQRRGASPGSVCIALA